MSSDSRRKAATESHRAAVDAINVVFDRLDAVCDARRRLADLGALDSDSDVIADAEATLALAGDLQAALQGVRHAASAALGYRTRTELAADVGTKARLLFADSAAAGRRQLVTSARNTSMREEPRAMLERHQED